MPTTALRAIVNSGSNLDVPPQMQVLSNYKISIQNATQQNSQFI